MSQAPPAVEVRVPATTANLGPGFDALGMALGLYDVIWMAPAERPTVRASGLQGAEIPLGEANLVVRAAQAVAAAAGRRLPGPFVRLELSIPIGRGLGSSAAAAVGGAVAANALLGCPLDEEALLQVAAGLEGHPDNAAPALLGGVCAACLDGHGKVRVVRLDPPRGLVAVAAIPERPVLTAEARRALPSHVPLADAVANIQRVALLVAGLARGRLDVLGEATQDRLHQPYRAHLVPGLYGALEAARRAGAYAAFLSGSGPTVLALVADGPPSLAEAVGSAMGQALAEAGTQAAIALLQLDRTGATWRPGRT